MSVSIVITVLLNGAVSQNVYIILPGLVYVDNGQRASALKSLLFNFETSNENITPLTRDVLLLFLSDFRYFTKVDQCRG